MIGYLKSYVTQFITSADIILFSSIIFQPLICEFGNISYLRYVTYYRGSSASGISPTSQGKDVRIIFPFRGNMCTGGTNIAFHAHVCIYYYKQLLSTQLHLKLIKAASIKCFSLIKSSFSRRLLGTTVHR